MAAVSELKACDLNAWGGDVHEFIKPIEGEAIVEKNRINSFHRTNLKQVLDEANIDGPVKSRHPVEKQGLDFL